MKLAFTKKLILDSIEFDNDFQIIRFASYLKEEFIERMIKLSIKNNIIENIYFSSNDYGTATWVNEKGFIDSHRWETEDDLNEISYLSRHYPASLENGKVPEDYVFEKIIPDILWDMIDLDLSFDIFRIIKSPHEKFTYDWNSIIIKNKKLSDDFINELIVKYENEIKRLEEENNEQDEESVNEKIEKSKKNETLKHAYITFQNLLFKLYKLTGLIIKKSEEKTINNISSLENPKEVNDIKEYLERAKKLSGRIKKF